jgi:hypothetical protein
MKSKAIIYFILYLILLIACNSQKENKIADQPGSPADNKPAEISFREYEHDFGKIVEGEKVAHIFAFENKGPGDLVIASTSTSCGCTATKYDRNPIAAGKEGTLEVVFDSNGRNGIQTKTISVRSNSKTEVVMLKITAEVVSGDR